MSKSLYNILAASLAMIVTGAAIAADVPVATEKGPSGEATVSAGIDKSGFTGVGVSGRSGDTGGGVHLGADGSVGVSAYSRSGDTTVRGEVTRGADGDTSVSGGIKHEF